MILIRKFICRNDGGLLISLVVGIGILSFMTMISIPAYQRFRPNVELSGASREMVANLRYAQQMTISEQIVYAVEIDTALSRYSILSLDVSTTTIKTVILPSAIEFQSTSGFTNDLVRFNSYGAVSEAGEINLVNENGTIKTITIKPSGYVQSSQ